MDAKKVDTFIALNHKYFPTEKLMFIRERLEQVDDNKSFIISTMDLKDPTTILLISVLIGSLGIDRFMIGDIGLGILKLLTFGVCGIFTIVDWFLISNRTKEKNFELLMGLL